MSVPFNRPTLAGRELDHIKTAMAYGQLAGDGSFTSRCQKQLASLIGCKAVLLTHSCTAALEMAMLLLDIQPGDEVIMPSYTFVSTANAVALRKGIPVFVDIRPDTLNIDESLLEAAITEKTRAILPIHYAGVTAPMPKILEIANRHHLPVVEDAAQALGASYEGKNAGTFGALAAFSFHETKNIISGEGGCLAINDDNLLQRAEIIREKGTNRSRFFRGEVDKYTWVDIGSSYLPGELIASFLWGQLEAFESIQAQRLHHWNIYDKALAHFSNRGVKTPHIPQQCVHNAHLYYLIMPSAKHRETLIQAMLKDGIQTPFHYVPLHSSPGGIAFGRTAGSLRVTENISERLVRLPLFPNMDNLIYEVVNKLRGHLDSILD